MQRLTYVCASCRRYIGAHGISGVAERTIYSAASSKSQFASQADTGAPTTATTGTDRKSNDRFLVIKSPRNTTPRRPPLPKGPPRNAKHVPEGPAPAGEISEEFHRDSAYEGARFELDQLANKLVRDGSLVAEVFHSFEKFLVDYQVKNLVTLKVILLKHKLPELLVNTLIKYHSKIENLPSLSEVLRIFSSYGINDDKLWGNGMFAHIRAEFYDDAIELWQDWLDCQKEHPLSLITTGPGTDETTSYLGEPSVLGTTKSPHHAAGVSSYESRNYPAVAAITAFLLNCKLLMVSPELSDVLQFLSPAGEGISNMLPSLRGFETILKENDIAPDVTEWILINIRTFRPYSDQPNEDHISIFDQAFLAASNGDLKQVQAIFEESRTRIPEHYRGRTYYTSFINAFMQCGSRENGDTVWSEMLSAGVIPTAGIWAFWLDGCAKAKDVKLFDQSWSRMLDERVAPNSMCWTIRMQMHFILGDPESGKLSLQGMVNDGVPVTINTINIAIKELYDADLYDDASDLVKWAISSGIQPDIVTYNITIGSRVKRGDFQGAVDTLRYMERSGIFPDIVTYGIILRGMYQNSSSLPNIKILQDTMEEMRVKGVSPNLQFYNTIIQAMLDRFYDIQGALYVLSLMPNDAWRGSSHTSSIFINYYSRTANMTAIEEVWANMRRQFIAPDEDVYNAMVSAYAKADLPDKMMDYLVTMVEQRKRVRVLTYIRAIRCLMARGDYERAKEVFGHVQTIVLDIFANKELRELFWQLKIAMSNTPPESFLMNAPSQEVRWTRR